MRPVGSIPLERLERLEFLFTDVDDTITSGGKLYPETLDALWGLKEAGVKVIPVTGGSAGWADCYVRQWPVEAVITESGALAFYFEDGVKQVLTHPGVELEGYEERKRQLIDSVLAEVAGSKLSSDQFCRVYDVAFDHHGERPFNTPEQISAIADKARSLGASVGISSIHVNCWFGSFDKLSMVNHFSQHRYGLTPGTLEGLSGYCGDSSNDIPLFRTFGLSVGVDARTISSFAREDQPAFITDESHGKGFCELADRILMAKGVSSTKRKIR